jgi:hypothetical protein
MMVEASSSVRIATFARAFAYALDPCRRTTYYMMALQENVEQWQGKEPFTHICMVSA